MKSSDLCFNEFLKLKSDIAKYPIETQTEADTRARIISRILHDVLDWPPETVNREENANPGFMDYVLLTNRRVAVLEAKKSGDTFNLPLDISTARNLTLNGIVRTVKNLKEYIDQVSAYCFSNGIEYAIVSNGLQFVVFKAVRTDGIHVGQGHVIVFSGLDDIEKRFVDFWNLLAKPNMDDNSLTRAFMPTDAIVFQYKRVTDELHRYKERISRNQLSQYLDPLIQEYLGEIADDEPSDKLKYCFVKSRSLLNTLQAINRQIFLNLSETFRALGQVVEPKGFDEAKEGIQEKLKTTLTAMPKGQVTLLLGRVGCGKTTFVSNFLRVELRELFDKHILVPLDFRLLEKGGNVRNFFYQSLMEVLNSNKVFGKLTSDQLREVYKDDIKQLRKGPLAKLEQGNKKLFEQKVSEFLLDRYKDYENHLVRVLRHIALHYDVRCVFVFDNADQHDFDLQQEIFRFAHVVTSRCYAFSIVSMWEETYSRSKQNGALAAYSTVAYRLPPTSVVEIIDRRLEYIVKELQGNGAARALVGGNAPIGDIIEYLELVKASIFRHGKRVRFLLESLAMGNLRKAMDVFSSFLTSGHTDAQKILWIWRNRSGYLVPEHEFIKSIGLDDYRYYRGDLSIVMNLYSISDESRPSHFTKIRLLEYLHHHRSHTTTFGAGFVRTDIFRGEFQRIGTSEADISESLRLLTQYSLVENDSYEPTKLGNAYRITPAGRFYLRFLAVKFAYLDLVLQDTALADHQLFCTLKDLVDSREMNDRFARVDAFLNYLLALEEREHAAVLTTSESIPLRRSVLKEMAKEYEAERKYILSRVKDQGDEAKRVATPYIEQKQE